MLTRILFADMSIGEKLIFAIIWMAVVLISLTVHEFAHGFTAYKLGDYTAKADGRLSLNPLRHIEPVGLLLLLFLGVGYAKPVPVMTRNFKKPRRDLALVSAAGPLSNFVLAFLCAMFYAIVCVFAPESLFETTAGVALVNFFYYAVLINVGLGLFNLIPIPPLDGSNILICLLPGHIAAKYAKLRYYSRYLFLVLVAATWIPALSSVIFYPIDALRSVITTGFTGFWFMIFG